MKLTTILLIAGLMQVSAASFGQRLTLNQKNITLDEVFREIRKQTGYDVLLINSKISTENKINAAFTNAALEEVLDKILEGKGLSYAIEDKTIVIREKEPSLIDKIKSSFGVQINVTGKLVDETGKPMTGVTVKIKNTALGVITDAGGKFAIVVPDDNTVVVFSFIGYETQELRAKDIITGSLITLKASVSNLHEVVINKGYYSERRALSTGNVSIVSAKEIEQQPVTNALAALEGRVPGLFITQSTGAPGGGYTVQIRGKNSLVNGNDPFYVVDGIPYASQTTESKVGYLNSNLGSGNPLNFINPYDIETIEILKDADATVIYGSRAANGAILITTKKGRVGNMKVDVNLNSGIGDITRNANLLNTQQYLAMRHEAFKNDGTLPNNDIDYDLTLWDTTRYTNWEKVLLGNKARYTDAQVSFSGGTTNTQYLIGGGYNRSTSPFPTLLPGSGADEKGSVHFSITSSTSDNKFKIILSGSYLSDKNTVQSTNLTQIALTLPPDAPAIFNSDGSLNYAPRTAGQLGTWTNPYSSLENPYNGSTSNLVANAILSYQLLRGLNAKVSLGYTGTQASEIATFPTTDIDPNALILYNITSGYSSFITTSSHSWIIEPQVDYGLNIGKGKFSVLAGGTFNESINQGQFLNAQGFSSDALLQNIQAASSMTVASSTYNQYKYNAIYGRLNYNLEDKYIVNLTGRRDGSSRFGPGKQFANFWAVGAAWIFSNEDFIKNNLPFISFGKLRGSYGTSGNDQIGDYQFIDLYGLTYLLPYQGTQGLYPSTLFNPNLAWEINRKLEGGIELSFAKNTINVSASYYRNRTNNQLVSTPISTITGFSFTPSNLPALVQNTGIELELNTSNIKNKNFAWESSVNVTIPRNKLLSYPNLASSPYANQFVIGQPITIVKAFHMIGVNDTTGVYQFADHNGKPTYAPDYTTDNTKLINTAPQFYGGFSNTFRYKNLSLTFLFQFVKQTGLNIFNSQYLPGTMFNEPITILNRWQKPGDIKPIEQFSQSSSGNAYAALNYYAIHSDFVYSDASYIRLKNLSISYTLPANWIHKLHVNNLRFYIQGQNLITITGYNGYDPETQGTSLPPLRIWITGLQITL